MIWSMFWMAYVLNDLIVNVYKNVEQWHVESNYIVSKTILTPKIIIVNEINYYFMDWFSSDYLLKYRFY
jgi:hypothetical protein